MLYIKAFSFRKLMIFELFKTSKMSLRILATALSSVPLIADPLPLSTSTKSVLVSEEERVSAAARALSKPAAAPAGWPPPPHCTAPPGE